MTRYLSPRILLLAIVAAAVMTKTVSGLATQTKCQGNTTTTAYTISADGRVCFEACGGIKYYKYYWCYTEGVQPRYSWAREWDYCSPENEDYYGRKCITNCTFDKDYGYHWCYTGVSFWSPRSWGYCSLSHTQ